MAARKGSAAKSAAAEATEATEAEATETVEGADAEATDAEATTGKRGPQKGQMPVYGLQKVEAPPEPPPTAARGGRTAVYMTLLAPIVADEDMWGDWFEAAYFKTPTGANGARKGIEKGTTDVPAGKWQLSSVKVARREFVQDDEGNDTDEVVEGFGSALFVKYLGPDEDAE